MILCCNCKYNKVCYYGHMSELCLALIDGPSQVGKSTLTRGIANGLQTLPGLIIDTADAGEFFRGLGDSSLSRLGYEHYPSSLELPDGAMDKVLEISEELIISGEAYAKRGQGDLHRQLVSDVASAVGREQFVQYASERWWEETVLNALEDDTKILVMNGRNPLDRVRDIVEGRAEVSVGLHLLAECDPAVAAERLLLGRKDNPLRRPADPELLAAYEQEFDRAEAQIVRRREDDTKRDTFPYVKPSHYVPFLPSQRFYMDMIHTARGDFSGVVAFENPVDPRLPLPIRIDTAEYPRDVMIAHAVGLGRVALPSQVHQVAYV
jgi:hypothetical protein